MKFRELVVEKLEVQEIELLAVFKSTINKMMEEVREMVGRYEEAMMEVKVDPQIEKLKNQLSYFKTEALNLF